MNYNQEYINQFGEKFLLEYLKSRNSYKLDKIYESYLNQFSSNKISDPYLLLIKESIDHLIVKKINEDKIFINTEEFKNYAKYIKNISNNFSIDGIAIEIFTNPVFLNNYTHNALLSILKPSSKINYNSYIDNTNNKLSQIIQKMNKGELITQIELDSICRVFALKNTPSDKNYNIVLTYILHYMKNYPSLKINLNELSFVACTMPNLYSELGLPKGSMKKVRIKIGDIIENNKSIVNAFYNGESNCVQIGKKLAEKCTSLNKESIYIHRDIKNISDLYTFIFVCNHELSHARQNILAKGNEYNSTGLAYIISKINNDRLGDYRNCNHDADEIEINADEQSWQNTGYIFNKFVNEDKELSNICYKNIEACVNRRAFSHKRRSKNQIEPIFHGKYDVEEAKESVKKANASIFNEFPQLKLSFNPNGEINYKCLSIKNFVDNWDRLGGTSEHSFGNEMSHYIIQKEGRKLIDYINNNNYSYDEILQVVNNLNELIHADAYYLRRLKTIDFEQYKETKAQFDIKNKINYIYTFFFIRNIQTLNNLRKICKAIETKYPQIKAFNSSWNANYYYEIMYSLESFDNYFSQHVDELLEHYKQSNDPYLIKIANDTEQYLSSLNNTDLIEMANDAEQQLFSLNSTNSYNTPKRSM